jgi:hypothetical protein
VRIQEGRPCYPLVIQVDDVIFEARSSEEYVVPSTSPWADSYLLPSQRLSYVKFMQVLSKIGREIVSEHPETRLALGFIALLPEFLRMLPVPPPMSLFLEDLIRLYTGAELTSSVELKDVGYLYERISPLLSLISYEYQDPFTKLRLTLDLAPDGFVDYILIQRFIDNAPRRSLIVIEEPENYKNPLLLIELVRYLAEKVVQKNMFVIITTHSDLLLQACAKTVEEKILTPHDIAIYYLERTRDNPWTFVRRIAVYEDGTIEEIPHQEQVIAKLF